MTKLLKMQSDRPPAPVPLGAVARELVTQKPQKYAETGLRALDDIIVGLVYGELTLVAGRPGQGKTSLAMTILENNALAGRKSGLFSMEMGRRALAMRRLSGRTGIDIKDLRRGTLTSGQKAARQKAADELLRLPLYIDDRGGLDGPQIEDTVALWKDQGIEVIGLDYIQLMRGKNESRQVQVGDAVKAIKNAAVKYDVPILALSQVNRDSTKREDSIPRMSDLRDSGELEQVADTILMFHYPEDDQDAPERVCDLHVVKQRNGDTGVCTLRYIRSQTRFEDFNRKADKRG